DSQRQATKDAGRIAGLDVVRIVNEPTAASLAYGLHRLKEGVIAVYDLGGGTFDISILRVKDGVFEVLATNGNTHLGGDDFDRAIVVWLLDDIRSKHGVYLGRDSEAMQELRLAAEAAKVRLSTEERTTLTIPFEGFTYHREITRADPTQHDEPDERERDVHDVGGRADRRRPARRPGRARARRGLPFARPLRAPRARPDAGGDAEDRGHVPHRRQRDLAGPGQGAADRQGRVDRGETDLRAHGGRGRADGRGVVRLRGGRRRGAAPHRDAQRGGHGDHPRRAGTAPGCRPGGRGGARPHPDGAGGAPRRPADGRPRPHSRADD